MIPKHWSLDICKKHNVDITQLHKLSVILASDWEFLDVLPLLKAQVEIMEELLRRMK